jgi:hypothetical protein
LDYVPQRLHEIADLGPVPVEMTGLKTRTAKHLAGGLRRNSTRVSDLFGGYSTPHCCEHVPGDGLVVLGEIQHNFQRQIIMRNRQSKYRYSMSFGVIL